MKYTDRKKTPLKWHHTVTFILQPLFLIALAYLLLCMINELFQLHIGFLPQIFTPILLSVDSSLRITNLGSMFWPVTGIFFGTVLILILCIYVWIGLLRWKNYAKNLWLIYLLVRAIGMIGFTGLFIYRSDILQALRIFAAFDSMSRTLLHVLYALLITICLWNLIFLVLNVIYYRKRRPLFSSSYVQMKDTGSEETAERETDADSSEEKTDIAQEQAENSQLSAEEDISPEKETGQEKQTDENAESSPEPEENNDKTVSLPSVSDDSESDQQEDKKEEKSSDEDSLSRNPNQVFCPYCGAKLGKYDVVYCSHCGRKLS